MAQFVYTPDKDQKVHAAGAIALICSPFQSHENGLPEWAKNSADAYGRDGTPAGSTFRYILPSPFGSQATVRDELQEGSQGVDGSPLGAFSTSTDVRPFCGVLGRLTATYKKRPRTYTEARPISSAGAAGQR